MCQPRRHRAMKHFEYRIQRRCYYLLLQFSQHFGIITRLRIRTSAFTALIQLTSLRLPVGQFDWIRQMLGGV